MIPFLPLIFFISLLLNISSNFSSQLEVLQNIVNNRMDKTTLDTTLYSYNSSLTELYKTMPSFRIDNSIQLSRKNLTDKDVSSTGSQISTLNARFTQNYENISVSRFQKGIEKELAVRDILLSKNVTYPNGASGYQSTEYPYLFSLTAPLLDYKIQPKIDDYIKIVYPDKTLFFQLAENPSINGNGSIVTYRFFLTNPLPSGTFSIYHLTNTEERYYLLDRETGSWTDTSNEFSDTYFVKGDKGGHQLNFNKSLAGFYEGMSINLRGQTYTVTKVFPQSLALKESLSETLLNETLSLDNYKTVKNLSKIRIYYGSDGDKSSPKDIYVFRGDKTILDSQEQVPSTYLAFTGGIGTDPNVNSSSLYSVFGTGNNYISVDTATNPSFPTHISTPFRIQGWSYSGTYTNQTPELTVFSMVTFGTKLYLYTEENISQFQNSKYLQLKFNKENIPGISNPLYHSGSIDKNAVFTYASYKDFAVSPNMNKYEIYLRCEESCKYRIEGYDASNNIVYIPGNDMFITMNGKRYKTVSNISDIPIHKADDVYNNAYWKSINNEIITSSDPVIITN